MNLRIAIRWCAIAGLCAWHGLVHAAIVAMVLDVKGQASITYAGRTSAAQIATSVQEDTKVEIGSGGQVSLVHYATREQLTVAGPAVVMITATAVKSVEGAQVQSRKLADDQAKITTNYRGRVVPGALAMRGMRPPVEITYPREGETILGVERAFAWEADDPQGKFQVRLFAGEKQLAEQTVTGASLAPAKLAVLAPGITYRIRVVVGDEKPAEVKFTIATPERREALQSLKPKDRSSVEPWVLYAMALEVDGVVSDAKEAWSVVAKIRPEAAGVARRLAR